MTAWIPVRTTSSAGRTFTIYEAGENGVTEVFTSGDDFEALTAQYLPDYYNCSNDNAVVDDRSGKKGPEAESVTVGTVDGRTYAFVALERTGGVMVYDVTEPASARYVNYINTRDFASVVEGSEEYEDGELDKWVTGGDVAPRACCSWTPPSAPPARPCYWPPARCPAPWPSIRWAARSCPSCPSPMWRPRMPQAVRYVYENGLMAGVTETQFAPDQTLTRGELTSILWKLGGQSPGGGGRRRLCGHRRSRLCRSGGLGRRQRRRQRLRRQPLRTR